MKAELSIGAAVKTLVRKYKIPREAIFISTKNGYIPVITYTFNLSLLY